VLKLYFLLQSSIPFVAKAGKSGLLKKNEAKPSKVVGRTGCHAFCASNNCATVS
jgi:hypothetical protein